MIMYVLALQAQKIRICTRTIFIGGEEEIGPCNDDNP